MKFLSIFLAASWLLCVYFYYTDAPGSGMLWPVVGIPALFGVVCGINWYRTGKWFTDSSGGR